MRRRDIIAAAVLIVCGLIYGYLAWGLPERSLPNTPGPPFFPLIVAAIIVALSAALLIQALGVRDDKVTPVVNGAVSRGDPRPALWALAAFLAYVVVLLPLGFIVATVPFFAVLMVLLGERRSIVVGVGAVAATGILYVIFRHGFGIFLPRGILAGIVT